MTHRSMTQLWRQRSAWLLVWVLPIIFVLVARGAGGATGLDAQTAARRFCQIDGLGARVTIAGWAEVAPLVSWELEPAWDHAVLITGYEVGPPRPRDGGAVIVEVRYGVIGQVSAPGVEGVGQLETVALELKSVGGDWRILGPPPPPHLFANRVDADAMRRSFDEGGMNFVANTRFVWQMLRSAGWAVDYQSAAELLSGTVYRAVDQPLAGDLVAYVRDGAPYHVGLLDAENQIVSSTINAGIVRAPLDAFAGDVKYLRLIEPEPTPSEAAGRISLTAMESDATPTSAPNLGTPRKSVQKRRATQVTKAPRRSAQSSKSRAVKRKGNATPAATARRR